jgi:hypothetical protein
MELPQPATSPALPSDQPPLTPVGNAEVLPDPLADDRRAEVENPQRPRWFRDFGEDFFKDRTGDCWNRLHNEFELAKDDYEHYYSWGNLAGLAVGVAAAAPLANTSADMDARHWYQRHVRTETTDEFAQVMTYAGQFWLVLPVWMEGRALAGKTGEDYASEGGLYEWSDRTLRSIVVGVPPMLAMYAVLGSSRPDRNDSTWRPFQDIHGVSGHTFMGAVPFLTAASMVDDSLWKFPLLLGSMATGWARINNDRHFLSQVVLGWWMAYSSVRSVDKTQEEQKALSVFPTFTPEGPGVAVQLRY